MSSPTPLRIGILGTAKIARGFSQGVRPSPRVAVVAVASRDLQKAQNFAADTQIGQALGSYEELLADRDIDAIYIPLPNSLHAEWAIKAATAGKHVLCEKPLSVGATAARSMFDAAREHGVHLVEGFPYLAQPQTKKLRQLVRDDLGQLRIIQASFGFTLSDLGNIRMNPQLAGGALLDAGIYPVSLIRILAGENPARVQATAQWSSGPKSVDTALAATLEFDSGLLAQVTCVFNSCVHRQALIAGAGGVLQTPFLNHTSAENPGDMQLRLGVDAKAVDSVVRSAFANGFRAEAESFAALIDGDPHGWSGATPQESIDIALIVETILRSAHSGRVERLTGMRRPRRRKDSSRHDPLIPSEGPLCRQDRRAVAAARR